MAEMRFCARPSLLLAGLLLLALPAIAAAQPHPIFKPSNIQPIQPAKAPTKAPTKATTPPASPPATPASTGSSGTSSPTGTGTSSTGTGTSSTGTGGAIGSTGTTGTGTDTAANPPGKQIVVVVDSQGGRDQSGIAVPAPPPPDPTPLGVVAAGDRVSSPGTSTPAWKIALLALLAASEAFLVVLLVRSRSGTLLPAA